MNNKQKTYATLAAVVILSLIALNIYIFTGAPNSNEAYYKDLSLHSNLEGSGLDIQETLAHTNEPKPVIHMEELLKDSNKSIIVFGGEENKTQENSMTFQAAIDMIEALGSKTSLSDKDIYIISYQKGIPIKCENLLNETFTVEKSNTMTPGEKEVLFHLEYPSGTENKVEIEGRKVTIKTKTPKDLLGTAIFLKEKFF